MRGSWKSSRVVNLAEVLDFSHQWTPADKDLIRAEIKRLQPDEMRLQASGQAIALIWDDLCVAWICGGRIEYKPEVAPEGSIESGTKPQVPGMRYLPLSNWRHEDRGRNPIRVNDEICPTCFMALPLSGVCDDCG